MRSCQFVSEFSSINGHFPFFFFFFALYVIYSVIASDGEKNNQSDYSDPKAKVEKWIISFVVPFPSFCPDVIHSILESAV